MGGLSFTMWAWWIRCAVVYKPFPCVPTGLAAMVEDRHGRLSEYAIFRRLNPVSEKQTSWAFAGEKGISQQ